MSSLNRILEFADLLHAFRAVERSMYAKGLERNENDAEHSFSLAMLGWYVNETYNLGLDTEKILKYALAHDIVEVYAGDTDFYHKDQSVIDSKHEREEESAQRLREQFPEFESFHEVIKDYERREDAESRFLYALDKIEPMLSIYLDGGRTWRSKDITIDMLATKKRSKVSADDNVLKLFEELIEKLEAERNVLF